MPQMKLSLYKNTPFFFFLIALLVATVATMFLKPRFHPYSLEILETRQSKDLNTDYLYHDFDKDGYSELIEFITLDKRWFAYIKSFEGGTIDQVNFHESTGFNKMLFEDINGDGYDEIITITQEEDSLFIYVHDLLAKKVQLNRQFLFKTEANVSPTGTIAAIFPLCIASDQAYEQKVYIFAVRSSSMLPRAVYAFDLSNKRIIREFQTHSAFTQGFTFDLTGDGVEEIIMTGAAWGNFHQDAIYNDQTCWLFVLDQYLDPLFPPLSFSEYPSMIFSLPLEIFAERFLLAIPDYEGHKNLSRMMYVVDKKGRIHKRMQNTFKVPADHRTVMVSDQNPANIYGWTGNDQLLKLDHNLDVVRTIDFPFGKPISGKFIDFNTDGKKELIFFLYSHMVVYDTDLNLEGLMEFNRSRSQVSFRSVGPQKTPEIGLQLNDRFHRIEISENIFYNLIYVIFFVMTVSAFLLLILARNILRSIMLQHYIVNKYIYDSNFGVMITDQNEKILHANSQFSLLLNLPHSPRKGDRIENVFSQHSEIREALNESILTKKITRLNINVSGSTPGATIEIMIYPIGRFRNTCGNCIIEAHSSAPGNKENKIQTWSRAVQKMAHDIKTPLSTVNLNLKVLQTRLDKMDMPEEDRFGLKDDMEMMHTELEHIQNMTKNFLKFSNLDKPHFQAFDIRNVIEESVRKYQPYLSGDQRIEINIDTDIKAVWADPQQVELVFHNLLENALAAIREEGCIQISASMAQYLDKDFKEYLELEVADTGPGISAEDRHKIFEPYFTTKAEGTGMGLAIARKIIEDHGGTLDLHSKEHFGAVFTFTLPLIKDEDANE